MTEAAVDLVGEAVCPKHPTFLVADDRPCPMCEEWTPGVAPVRADYKAWMCPNHEGEDPVYVHPNGACGKCGWTVPKEFHENPSGEVAEVVEGTIVEAVEQFEGSDVVEWEMKLPGATVECDRSFKRGMVIRLAVEVRVRNVGYVERKDGTLTRVHQATLEDVSVVSAFNPSDNHENVGGNLSGSAPDESDEDAPDALGGLQVGRTQDAWPPREEE